MGAVQSSNNHPRRSVATADPTEYNVKAIAELEKEALHERSTTERISDVITGFAGSITCLIIHIVIFATWAVVNLDLVPGIRPFDPFPFGILTLVVSSEGVFLAIFILISQNRMTRLSDRRAHLDLQISMLAEQEMTLMLRLQQRLCEHFGLEVEEAKEEAQRLMQKTNVQQLVNDLEEELPS